MGRWSYYAVDGRGVNGATVAAGHGLTQQAMSCDPTESSERACSSAFTSSPKLDGSRASR